MPTLPQLFRPAFRNGLLLIAAVVFCSGAASSRESRGSAMTAPAASAGRAEASPLIAFAAPAELPELYSPGDRARGPATAVPTARPAGRGRPFVLSTSGSERDRAIECMTAAIYYEAATEPNEGQEAVAQVVLNRMRHPSYPKSVCGVVFQGSERRTGCQFSFTCDGAMYRRPSVSGWTRARLVAERALGGHVATKAATATHYHTRWIRPYWSPSLVKLGQIGAHIFYRTPGRGSTAFAGRYRGGELNIQHASMIGRPRAAAATRTAAAADPTRTTRAALPADRPGVFSAWGLEITPLAKG